MTPLAEQPKHNARSMYLVTSSPETVTAQKILHPLSRQQTKFMSKQYSTNPKHLRIIHRPTFPVLPSSSGLCSDLSSQSNQSSAPRDVPAWNPINTANWIDDSEDEEESDLKQTHNVIHNNFILAQSDDDVNAPDTIADHLDASTDKCGRAE